MFPETERKDQTGAGRQVAYPAGAPSLDLFTPVDPRVPREEWPRLSRQCAAILEALRAGPKNNAELARIALRYGARIKDLREAGYRIDLTYRDHVRGLNTYELKEGV